MNKSAKILCLCAALGASFALGSRFGPARATESGFLAPGTELTIDRPVGPRLDGVSGQLPVPTESYRLRIVKVRGAAPAMPDGELPWRVTAGGVTRVAVALRD